MGKKVRVRALLFGGVFTLFFFAVVGRLYMVQIVQGAELLEKAERVWSSTAVLQPVRGTITDRHGNILSQDGDAYTVAVNPSLIHENNQSKQVVDLLAPLLGMTSPEGISKLYAAVTAKRDDGRLLLQKEIRNEGWKIDKAVADDIRSGMEEQEIRGIYLIPEKKRYYTMNQVASHVVGYVDKDNKARSGIELFYDELLSGTPGEVSYAKDNLGYELPNSNGKATLIPPVDGYDIRLTLDRNIQHYIEEAMATMYEKYKPKSAMVIAADPNTMEILGMATYPNFNPNTYWSFNEQSDFANRNIGYTYEPGSTFKIVTLAGAVAEGLFNPDDKYRSGSVEIAGSRMGDHNNRQGWGEITYLEGLKRSSNVAFIKLGYEKMGEAKLREYISKFGFGQLSGIDLPGEVAGTVDFKWATEIASATFGQGKVAVTPIQQVAAISAIANGGKLMQPHLLKETLDPETGEVISRNEPNVIREVLSEATARKVSEYLEQVVSDQEIGTGRRAYIEGYRIAGKTGTAQKVVGKTYSSQHYVVSFIGYAPADDPKIVLSVIVDEPDIGGDYRNGSEVSGPLFKEIMGKSLRYLEVPKENTTLGVTQLKEANEIVMPDLTGRSLDDAGVLLNRNKLAHTVLGQGLTVVEQYPAKGEQIGEEQHVYILTADAGELAMPNMQGRSLRDVFEVCALLGADCTYSGAGYAASQQRSSSPPYSYDFRFEPLGVLMSASQNGEGETEDGETGQEEAESAQGE